MHRIGHWFLLIIRGITSLCCSQSPLDYNVRSKRARQLSDGQLQNELRELDTEIREFFQSIGDKRPELWSLGESAAYESIRRRDAQLCIEALYRFS